MCLREGWESFVTSLQPSHITQLLEYQLSLVLVLGDPGQGSGPTQASAWDLMSLAASQQWLPIQNKICCLLAKLSPMVVKTTWDNESCSTSSNYLCFWTSPTFSTSSTST